MRDESCGDELEELSLALNKIECSANLLVVDSKLVAGGGIQRIKVLEDIMAANTEDLEESSFSISVNKTVSIFGGLHKFLVGDDLNSLVCA